MSGLYVYCVVPAGHVPPNDLAGVDAWAVRSWSSDALGAWVSDADGRPEPTVERIQQHNRVVQAAVATEITPVPLRFGQWLPSVDALEQHIAERAQKYKADLELFAGALEYGIRALHAGQQSARNLPPQPGITGRQYMAALREQYRALESAEPVFADLRLRLQDVVGGFIRAEQLEPDAPTRTGFAVAHLVEHGHADAYRAGVRALRAEFSDLRFLLSGPWPPYTFAGDRG